MTVHAGIEFLKALFGPSTNEPVYCCSLPNNKGDDTQPGERSIMGRDPDALVAFINRWDRHGRGLYHCTSTIANGTRRNKINCVETPALPLDIDFKSILEDQATALRALQQARMPPSCIVRSGNGLHARWIFKEAVQTQDHLERLEAVMRQLADTFGGDPQVAHVASLMRLPGTHNTKGGQFLDVEVIEFSDRRYELEDLEEWLAEQSPLLRRKERPAPPEQNPYLAIASKLGFKPPIDVEQRLAAMVYQGAGEAAIHVTQRDVSASLLSRGHEVDGVVSLLLDATRAAAGDYGQCWNWQREERNIRNMCETWLKKIGSQTKQIAAVVQISEARHARAHSIHAPGWRPSATEKDKKFHVIAKTVMEKLQGRLLFEDTLLWHYENGLWSRLTDPKILLNDEIERACRHLAMSSNNRLVSEARGWLERNPDLRIDDIPWDRHGKVPARNGLIDPITLEFTPAKPEHYATWRVDCDYDPRAKCDAWFEMLEDAFSDRGADERAEVIATLQEILGAALLDCKSKSMHKALVLVGGTDCGKSQLLAVMGGLFGEKYIDSPIIAVDTPHGLVPFLERKPWVLDEAFAQNIWHLSATIKTIITGEGISINIKHGPILSHRFTGPIFWGSNHPPQFKENTRAIVQRLAIIKCNRKFDQTNPVGIGLEAARGHLSGPAELVLAREKAGLLVWALQGLKRVIERGGIRLSQESHTAAAQIYRDSNLVAGFFEDNSEYDSDTRISTPDICVAVACWYAENKGENRTLPSNESIGRALVALHDPRIVSDPHELRDNHLRYVIGVRLNAQGLEYHKRGTEANMFEGKTVNTTAPGGLVNKPIPASWDAKPVVVAMRTAHKQVAESAVQQLSLEVTV